MLAATPEISVAGFGAALRQLRQARRMSQLDLALQAEVSQRHLSFLESGRAQPSRAMVLQLAQALDLPLRERNRLLGAAGYAPLYAQRTLGSADMAPVRAALEMLLKHHEPYPALVVDRAWNLVMQNDACTRVFSLLGKLDDVWQRVCGDGPRNVLMLTCHPLGLQPYLVNFEEIASYLVARTQQEALHHPQAQAVVEAVLQLPGMPRRLAANDPGTLLLPVLPTHLRAHGIDLRMFTMLSTFGTPQDLTTDELRVETFFPMDAASASLLRRLAGT